MKTPHDKRIQALKQAVGLKQKETLARANSALKIMQERNLPISFQSVAKQAHVSKNWLYNQQTLRDQINHLRDKNGIVKRTSNLQITAQKKDKQIIALNKKIKTLEKTITQLKNQLEIVYGELYKLNNQ